MQLSNGSWKSGRVKLEWEMEEKIASANGDLVASCLQSKYWKRMAVPSGFRGKIDTLLGKSVEM